MVITTISFADTTFLCATCCLIYFIPIVKPFLSHRSWLRFNLEIGLTVGREWLLFHGTWSYRWYIQRSVFARSRIRLMRSIIVRHLYHVIRYINTEYSNGNVNDFE
jgi:hypothetical protein